MALAVAVLWTAAARAADDSTKNGVVTVPPVDISRYPHPKPFAGRPPVSPVFMLPHAVVEPRRNVPAHAWRSPYCLKWTDGVETCQRKAVGQSGTCTAEASPAPKRHAIGCVEADLDRLSAICWKSILVELDPMPRHPNPDPHVRDLHPLGHCSSQENWLWNKEQGWHDIPGNDCLIGYANSVTPILRRYGIYEYCQQYAYILLCTIL